MTKDQASKLTILSHYPEDRHLIIGEASKVKKLDGSFTLLMACPKCGTEMILSNHNIIWHDEKTVTVEPSLVCDAIVKSYSDQILHESQDCMGHFYIKNGEITDLS